MKITTYLALTGTASAFAEVDHEFLKFVAEHGKSYGTKEEFEFRAALFKETYEFVQEHNSQGKSYSVSINKFADWTPFEKKKLNGFRPQQREKTYADLNTTGDLPAERDWREEGAVSQVYDQGQCGSCWAFSAAGAFEGLFKIKHDSFIPASAQQLIDCSIGKFGNFGCNGGAMDNAFTYYETYGAEDSIAYPYASKDEACRFDEYEIMQTVGGFQDVKANKEDLKAALAQQPVSVAVSSFILSFQHYSGGIYDDASCTEALDHALLAIGYGTSDDGTDYWLLKNTWGTDWGEDGYMRMTREGLGNMCGVLNEASFPHF